MRELHLMKADFETPRTSAATHEVDSNIVFYMGVEAKKKAAERKKEWELKTLKNLKEKYPNE